MNQYLRTGNEAGVSEAGDKHSDMASVVMGPIKVIPIDWVRPAGAGISSFSYRFLKRLIDLGVACVFLMLLAPLFLIIALIVRMSSPGPIFYWEKRIGRLGRDFTIYKFRSMYTPEYLATVLN